MSLRDLTVRSVGLALLFLPSAAALAQAEAAAPAQVAAAADAEIETCLGSGQIRKTREKLVGVTRPVKVMIDCDLGERAAVFKFVDEHKRGVTRLSGGRTEVNFSDSYLYERAAYLLDRLLGLTMVPVAVHRIYQGRDGILVDWIPDAVHENRVSASLTGPQMAALFRQKSRMHLFDSLIYNTDRRPENLLVDESTGKLHLIDHSRAFRETKELREEFENGRVWLSRELYDGLAALNEEGLEELLDGLISRVQLTALLARRDLIVAKIDRDRQEHGDDAVFRSDDG